MAYLIGFIIGVVAYAILSFIVELTRSVWGTLDVDHSKPDKDVYRINIDDLDCLNVKKRVVLRVKHSDKHSQK
jgi:hypothetical protein